MEAATQDLDSKQTAYDAMRDQLSLQESTLSQVQEQLSAARLQAGIPHTHSRQSQVNSRARQSTGRQ